MINKFLINGKKLPGLNPFDRGLAFGDGVFRSIKIENGIPRFWQYHYEILSHDAKSIHITVPTSRILLNDIKRLFTEKGNYVAKFILTRGVSERGYQFKANIEPTRILLKNKFIPIEAKLYREGVNLQVCKNKLPENTMISGIKHLNRLENVLAKLEIRPENFDGIQLDKDNNINECISSTIIIRESNKILIPLQGRSGVSGVTKKIIIDKLSTLGYVIQIKKISLDLLMRSDEVVITNSIMGALPVRKVKNKIWKKFQLANDINQIFNDTP